MTEPDPAQCLRIDERRHSVFDFRKQTSRAGMEQQRLIISAPRTG
jgi:hypothetical protein